MRSLIASVGWWHALTGKGPVRILAATSLVDAWGTGMAWITLPFLAVQTLGLSAGRLAFALSVAGVCELVAAVPNGVLASRFGVRRFVVATHLVQTAAFAALAFATGFPALLAGGALAGLARAGAGGLNQSLTIATLGEDERAGALGAIRALRNIGYLLGGAVSALAVAADSGVALRAGLLANAASFLVGAVWTARLPRAGARAARTDWSVLADLRYLGLICSAATVSSATLVLTVGLPLWVLAHPDLPGWTAPLALTVNTVLVILFQYGFSQRVRTPARAIAGLRQSALALTGAAALIACTATGAPRLVVVTVLALAAVVLTVGELLESPSFWTLSYELAPRDRTNEYLSAFELNRAGAAIAGPPAMAGVVALGVWGWLLYGTAVLVAAHGGALLAARRPGVRRASMIP